MIILFVTFFCAFGNFRPFWQAWLLSSDWSQISDLWRFSLLCICGVFGVTDVHPFKGGFHVKGLCELHFLTGLSQELLLTHPWVTHLQQSTPLSQPAHSHTKLLRNIYLLLFTPSLQFKCWLYSTGISFCIQNEIVLFFISARARKWAGLSRSLILLLLIIKHCKSLVNTGLKAL